jgi:hypothetical protein
MKCVNCKEETDILFDIVTESGVEEWCGYCAGATVECSACTRRSEKQSASSIYSPESTDHAYYCVKCVTVLVTSAVMWTVVPDQLRRLLELEVELSKGGAK